MESTNPDCLVFLLRIWREPEEVASQAPGRQALVQIIDIADGRERYFASLREMVAYLETHWLGHSPSATDTKASAPLQSRKTAGPRQGSGKAGNA